MTREFVDLFAGCGMVSRGLRDAGLVGRLAVEWRPIAASSYHDNHGEVPLRMVNLFLESNLEDACRELGLLDTFSGLVWMSPPCQGLSTAGLQSGEDDVRNSLLNTAPLAMRLMPKAWVVLENVTGMLNKRAEKCFEALLKAARELEREPCDPWRLDALDLGLAQMRERVFVVFPPKGAERPPAPIPWHDGPHPRTMKMEFHPTGALPPCAYGGDLPYFRVTPRNKLPYKWVDPDPTFITEPTKPGIMKRAMEDVQLVLYGEMGPALHGSKNAKDFNLGRDYAQKKYLDLGEEVPDHFLKRRGWDEPSGACTKTKPRVGVRIAHVHPEELRYLSIGEVRALQGLPRSFHVNGNTMKQWSHADAIRKWAQIGEGIPPRMAELVARAILPHL